MLLEMEDSPFSVLNPLQRFSVFSSHVQSSRVLEETHFDGEPITFFST